MSVLEAMGAVARVTDRATDLDQAAREAAQWLGLATGCEVAHLCRASNPRPGILRSESVWNLDRAAVDPVVVELIELGPATGARCPSRQALEAHGPVVVDLAHGDQAWPSGADLKALGLSAALAVPVTLGEEVVAVVEMYSRHPLDLGEALLALLGHAGHQLARVEERTRSAATLRASEDRFRALADASRDAVITVGSDGTINSSNHQAEVAFGYTAEQLRGTRVSDLVPTRGGAGPVAGPLEQLVGDRRLNRITPLRCRRRDGSEFEAELSVSSWSSEHETYLVLSIRDLGQPGGVRGHSPTVGGTLHDPLTDLPTRALLADRLEQALARSDRYGSALAVASIDIDRFRAVNDSLGHAAGDVLLTTVARQLRGVLHPDDTLARVGGDEFVAILDRVGSAEEAAAVISDALARIDRQVELAGKEVELTMSSGIAWRAAGGRHDTELLIRDAEMAREQALLRGPGQVAVFDEAMRTQAARRAESEVDLRRALRQEQFRVVYQPIIDLTTGQITGVEALLRWDHPVHGEISPLDFIPLAEDTGLIVPIGHWVLVEATTQVAHWNATRTEAPLRIGVNVSARQVQQHDWVDRVASVLSTTAMDPHDLVLEITESVLMEDPDMTARRLAEVRALGVRIAVDDFGTGYSSLAYLRRFPVDILKIDKMFIDNVAGDPQESALAHAVVRLAEAMGLEAVAEGVARPEQFAALVRMRCRYGQGFLFARPMDPGGVEALLGGGDLRP